MAFPSGAPHTNVFNNLMAALAKWLDTPVRQSVFAALFAMTLAFEALAEPPLITGAARVVDGDGIVVMVPDAAGGIAETEIRLEGIDAPETAQICNRRADGAAVPCGVDAATYLAGVIAGREVRCAPHGRDRYGRTLALCRTADGEINEGQVRAGHAVAYRRYLQGRPWRARLMRAEAEARADGRGIWSTDFTWPETWRRLQPR